MKSNIKRLLFIFVVFIAFLIQIDAQRYVERTIYPIELNDSCKIDNIKLDTVFYPYTESDSRVFIQTDELPQFPGGNKALADFFRNNVIYPDSAIKANIEGPVTITFSINAVGCVNSFRFIKILHFGIDVECIRVLEYLPRFKPGAQLTNTKKGMYWRPVTVWYFLPLYFTLGNDETKRGVIIKPRV
jgi:hypothetical protein